MSDKRVVLFTAGHTERNGGLARHGRLLAEGFVHAGWDVRVISRAGSLWRPRVVRQRHLLVLELPGFGRRRLGGLLYLAVAIPLGILWARQATGCLAVHLGTTTVAAGISASVCRRPFTALSTSSGPMGEVEEAARCNPAGLRRLILRRARFLVAQSDATAPELHRLTDPSRVAVVPNPVTLPHPPPLDERRRAIFVGRLSDEKDPRTLVAAWRTVLEHHPDAVLDIVGVGGGWRSVEHDLRRDVAADGTLARSVFFHGWIDDVPYALVDHDVFVLPSKTFEGMSNSLLEACSFGRVVVASDIPPNVAVLGDDYPLLFRAGAADELAAQLLRAFDDGSLRRRARARVLAAVALNDVAAVIERHVTLLTPSQSSSTSR